jgi:hypothetical protein
MINFERFAKALALTESNDDALAWGDEGLACGRWQMHPAWVADWWPRAIQVNWSWDRVFREALILFYFAAAHRLSSPIEIAMEFHLGRAAFERGDHDEKYAERFANWYAKLGQPETPAKEG